MSATAEDLYELLRSIRVDCTAIQSRITSAFALLAELNIQDVPQVVCPVCRAKLRGPRTLENHLHVSHPDAAVVDVLDQLEQHDWLDNTRPA